MGLYRDETGTVIEVSDDFAEARAYTPLDPGDRDRLNAEQAYTERAAERADERGLLGSATAGVSGVLSGFTLGGTDLLLANTLTDSELETLRGDMEAHPYLRTGGEIVGGVASAFAAPGSVLARTPAGYLGAQAARQVEAGLARGGIGGTAKALTAMGVEGAAQNAGQYIGHSALEDKEVTAEGMAGALGTGFAFGSVGGGAVLGITKGAMAGRRLYSRVMDGPKAAQAAESTWTLARQEALDADLTTAGVAENKLDGIRKAKMEALRYRNETRAAVQESKIAASQAVPEPGMPMPTSGIADEAMGPMPLDEGISPSQGGMPTSMFKRPAAVAAVEATPTTKVIPRPEGVATDLEGQLAGTKAKLDEGAALKDIKGAPPRKAGKGNESDSIAKWLDEQDAFDAQELSRVNRIEDLKGADDLRMRRQDTLAEIRFKATEDLLGAPMAKLERDLVGAVDEYKAARADLEKFAPWGGTDGPSLGGLDEGPIPVMDVYGVESGLKRVGPTDPTRVLPGKRQAMQILDDAHEEALLRAKYGADPREAGQAITEAQQLEDLLEGLSVPDVAPGLKGMTNLREVARGDAAFMEELAGEVAKVQRYEEASAKLADVIGDQAHQTSVMRAKGLRDAEKDSMRKVMDRSARAVDDAAEYGPMPTPKERVASASAKHNDARSALDELNVQEIEARDALSKANKQVKIGEKAKKAALRDDAKLAKAATSGIGAADKAGIWEIMDVPGLPKVSDLPVIGPLLGPFLKARTMMRAMGKMMGKVSASADNRVAALASQTRDRIARAVDRSLGLVARGGKYATRAMPPVAGILSSRIYDDGDEDPGKDAPIQAQAAARMRELAAYVHTPGAIERDVRIQLRGVTDPDLIAAAEAHRRVMMEHLLQAAPKVPEQGIIKTLHWEPSPAQSMSFARRLEAVNDPAATFERLAQENTLLSLEAADAMRAVYPQLFAQAQQRAMERASEPGTKVAYRQRVQMSLFYQMPFDSALEPANFKITQSVYDRKPSSPAYNPEAPGVAPPAPTAVPAIANPVDLSQAYTPSMDRR
jgi:hypothetical protein